MPNSCVAQCATLYSTNCEIDGSNLIVSTFFNRFEYLHHLNVKFIKSILIYRCFRYLQEFQSKVIIIVKKKMQLLI